MSDLNIGDAESRTELRNTSLRRPYSGSWRAHAVLVRHDAHRRALQGSPGNQVTGLAPELASLHGELGTDLLVDPAC
ncbi:hypothetical protein [Streptomyces sp. SID13726]|uniref:hypothetical protein n=1 Tax=Streptomyces sp. SID13726 TaxID=2706058 RepID=UPI0013BAE67A|nr:hypothetical protein [Streptomyces sp. SID13726]NEB01901.1 hypothetical protein [Streptomyces sp. SID13726]